MTYKSAPILLIGEASTSKVKGKRARRYKKKKEKEKVSQPLLALQAPLLLQWERAKGKGRTAVQSGRGQMMFAFIAVKRGIGRGSTHNFSPTHVLERSRRLSKDKMIQGSVMTRSLLWNQWDLSS
ncbi:UNVERIFIED_CONTAM: hypothetical protein Sindi_0074200 [Sesamum indicum]